MLKTILQIICFFLVTCALTGCASVGLPKTPDDEAIRKGEKVLVLLKTIVEVGGRPADINALRLGVASISQGESIKYNRPVALSAETLQMGWRYLILEAGETYYLRTSLSLYDDISLGMWFQVPHDKQLVYIGSLSTSCHGKKPGGIPEYVTCSNLTFNDETIAAKAIAHNLLASYGELTTSLMRPWPTMSDPQANPMITPASSISLTASATKILVSPDWYNKSFNKSVVFANPGGGSGALGLIFLAAELAYLPIGITIGAAGGYHSDSKWQPCVDRLSEGLRSYDYAQQMQTAVSDALRAKGFSDTVKISTDMMGMEGSSSTRQEFILKTDVHRVSLAECKEEWTFFVDTSIRASLRRADSNHYLYDRVFGESDRENRYGRYPYQSSTTHSSTCRKIEEYCDASGPNIFRAQLISSVNAAAQEIVKDLTQQPHEEKVDGVDLPPR